MSNKVYDILKWVSIIVIPALSTLYATLGNIWGLPLANEIPQTITAVGAFLGAVLMISNYNYKKGGAK